MKILLFQPASNYMKNKKEGVPFLPPLGLMYIASTLREAGYTNVKIVDVLAQGYYNRTTFKKDYIRYGLSPEDIKKIIEKEKPTIVASSAMCSLRKYHALEVCKLAKEVNPDIVTVLGGNPVTVFPKKYLRHKYVDYAILGEGEEPFLKLIKMLDNKGKLEDINGIAYKEKVALCANNLKWSYNYIIKPQKHWEKDIDKIPFPAHDLIDLDMYHKLWKETGYQVYEARKFSMSVMARGCPNKCFHCCHDVLFPGYRARSAKNLFEEVKWCYSLGIREIMYMEYNGLVNWKIVEEFCHLMINSGLSKDFRWGWPIGIWLKVLTREKLKLMREAGMDYLCLAIEGYDEQQLDEVMPGKEVDLKHTLNVIKWGREFGYQLHAFFMLGLEGQTKLDIEKTIEFSKTLDLDSASFFIAQPLPGTPMFKHIKDNNLFIDGFDTFMLRYGKCNHKIKNISPQEVEAYRHRARKEFVESRVKLGRKRMPGKRGKDYLMVQGKCC